MKGKSVMFFGWFFYPKVGGAETIMLNQARELVARGYEVSVLTSVLDDGKEGEDEIFGIKVIRRKYINAKEVQDKETIERDLTEIMSRIQPDLFHFHNGSYPSGSHSKLIGAGTIVTIFNTVAKFDIPIIEHAHNAQLKAPEETKTLRDLPWDCLICVSKFVQQKWEELGTGAKSMEVVYNGIDTELFEGAEANKAMSEIKKDDEVVLFSPARLLSMTTGEFNKQKNLELVFDALEILIKRKITNFVLVSIINDVSDVRANDLTQEMISGLIKQKGLEGKVVFVPTIDPTKMPNFYAGADIVCVPALYETFGLMYLEAMAAGKVVIASNTGGPREYINNNENGYFVDPKNANELADLLENLIKDRGLRLSVGEKAKISAKRYTSKKMTDGVEEVYKRLLER